MKANVNKYDVFEMVGAVITCAGTIIGLIGAICNRGNK